MWYQCVNCQKKVSCKKQDNPEWLKTIEEKRDCPEYAFNSSTKRCSAFV